MGVSETFLVWVPAAWYPGPLLPLLPSTYGCYVELVYLLNLKIVCFISTKVIWGLFSPLRGGYRRKGVQNQPLLHCSFETSLGYLRSCLKTKKQKPTNQPNQEGTFRMRWDHLWAWVGNHLPRPRLCMCVRTAMPGPEGSEATVPAFSPPSQPENFFFCINKFKVLTTFCTDTCFSSLWICI